MAVTTADRRTSDLKLIHVAIRQLGLSREDYEAVLWAVGRVQSSKDLDHAGRARLIDHLKHCGFKVQTSERTARNHPGRPHNITSPQRGPQLRKIEALLTDAGREWAYVDSMAKRMFQVERVSLCHEGQLQKIIAALTYDQTRRAGR